MIISITGSKLDGVSSSLERLKASCEATASSVKTAIQALNLIGGDSSATLAAKENLNKKLAEANAKTEAAKRAKAAVDTFVANTLETDSRVASTVSTAHKQFLAANPWAVPGKQPVFKQILAKVKDLCHTAFERVFDFGKKAVAFVVMNADKIAVAVGAAALTVAVIATGGAVLPLLAGIALATLKAALAAAAVGAVIGGIIGGLTTGTWQGVGEGALTFGLSGAKGGAAFGFAGASISGMITSLKALQAMRAANLLAAQRLAQAQALDAAAAPDLSLQQFQQMVRSNADLFDNPEMLTDDFIKHVYAQSKHIQSSADVAVTTTQLTGQPIGYVERTLQNGSRFVIKSSFPAGQRMEAMLTYDRAFSSIKAGNAMLVQDLNALQPSSYLQSILRKYNATNNYLVQTPDGAVLRVCIDKAGGFVRSAFPESNAEVIRSFLSQFH